MITYIGLVAVGIIIGSLAERLISTSKIRSELSSLADKIDGEKG
jgi:uncharacterized membrane-anchored protein YhcB (DUF1043 family)